MATSTVQVINILWPTTIPRVGFSVATTELMYNVKSLNRPHFALCKRSDACQSWR